MISHVWFQRNARTIIVDAENADSNADVETENNIVVELNSVVNESLEPLEDDTDAEIELAMSTRESSHEPREVQKRLHRQSRKPLLHQSSCCPVWFQQIARTIIGRRHWRWDWVGNVDLGIFAWATWDLKLST